MKEKLKVLHIASFTGNIGDVANHRGAEFLRNRYLDYEFSIVKKEIREFYWHMWSFNSEAFILESNQYDLIMIGGGNYFELWVEHSTTGTSIDMSIETMKRIKTPVLFYALGCDIGQGVPDVNIAKFESFLDYVTQTDQFFISVRNDGAMRNIESLYGKKYSRYISEIPDGGFFTEVPNQEHIEIDCKCKNVVINIAGDMLDVRYPHDNGGISYEEFAIEFARCIDRLHKQFNGTLNFIFVPHIFRDIKAIYDVLECISDNVRRSKIVVSPYLHGDRGHDYLFSLYKQADVVLGMRFHANVCGIGLKRKTIGLVNYIQIENLYKSINSYSYIVVNKVDFSNELYNKVEGFFNNPSIPDVSIDRITSELYEKAEKEYIVLNKWLHSRFDRRNMR